MVPSDLVVVGQIGAAFGVKGWLHVKSFAQPAENLLRYKPWYAGGEKVEVRELKPHGDTFVVSLAGIHDREAAQKWKGREIAVSRSILPKAGVGEFYWHDLIGLKVVSPQGHEMGQVDSLMETGSNDVLVVKAGKGSKHELLIPFIKDVIGKIDLDSGVLVADWPIDDI